MFLGLGLGDDWVVTGVGNVPGILKLLLDTDLGLPATGIAEGIFRPPTHIRNKIHGATSGISYSSSL